MNIKERKINELTEQFKEVTGLNKARVNCMVRILIAMLKSHTVCFVKLAQVLNEKAQFSSNLRRIQRFFSEFSLPPDFMILILASQIPLKPPYRLCLDRTNWKFGTFNINILMISICYEGLSFPLIWTMLPKRGNSSQIERLTLLKRYIALFGADSIECILADREFIGKTWKRQLIKEGIPFYIRIKGNMKIRRKNKVIKAAALFNDLPINTNRHLIGSFKIEDNPVYLSGLKIFNRQGKEEFVIIATYDYDENSFETYKDRWQIETMFKAFKTSGFNIEDTHLNDIERVSKLLSLVCMAVICAYAIGIYLHEQKKNIPIKKHGRKQYSYFKYGLIFITCALEACLREELNLVFKFLSCT